MKYQNQTFSLPVSNGKISDEEWDVIFKGTLQESQKEKVEVKDWYHYNDDGA